MNMTKLGVRPLYNLVISIGGMIANHHTLELLWKRVEGVRLQVQFARTYVKEISQDLAAGGIPSSDGNLAFRRALHAESLAVANYLRAVRELEAALEDGQNGHGKPADGNSQHLTRRQLEVLSLIASGKSSKQIAAELGMAFRTAVCHRYRLYQKLKVHTSVELTRVAMLLGLIEF